VGIVFFKFALLEPVSYYEIGSFDEPIFIENGFSM